MQPAVFYLVWREPSVNAPDYPRDPTKRHAERGEAEREAMRLAEKHPGVKFHVLRSLEDYLGACTVTRANHVMPGELDGQDMVQG